MTTLESEVEEISIPTSCEEPSLLPSYASDGASGADLRAKLDQPLILQPGERALIPTGCKMEIPYGYEIQIRPRSGLAYKNGITTLNSPGTIDADYRGEIGVILINHGQEPFEVLPGMRIAQGVVAKVVIANFTMSEELTETERGSGGFGHSGIH